MDYGYEIQVLKEEVNSLREAFLQSQRNQVPITEKVDTTSNNVASITPTTYTKTAYIGDTEVTFENVPNGNITVYAEDTEGNHPYFLIAKREQDNVTVAYANPFEYVTKITLSII